jgi:hypothetical protein
MLQAFWPAISGKESKQQIRRDKEESLLPWLVGTSSPTGRQYTGGSAQAKAQSEPSKTPKMQGSTGKNTFP